MGNTSEELGHANTTKHLAPAETEKTLHHYQSATPPDDVSEKQEKQQHEIDTSSFSSRGELAIEELDSKIIKVPDVKDGEEALASLPEHEREIVQRQLDVPPIEVKYSTLYRYATTTDWIIIAVSVLCAIAAGAALPLSTIVFGNLGGTFRNYFYGGLSGSAFRHQLGNYTLYFVYLAIGSFVTVYISTVGFIYVGEHMTQKIREQYLAAILRQNIAFFDKLGAGEITTRITADTNLIQDSVSEKVAVTLTALSMFVTAFVIGFVKYWKLTLILCSTVFAIFATTAPGSRIAVKFKERSLESYALGGSVAEEAISSIRNAVAFGTQDKLARQYDAHLTEAEKWGALSRRVMAIMFAILMCIIYLNYGLAFWMGARFLVKGEITLQSILTIILSIIMGAFSLGNVAPNAQAFTTGVAAAGKIFSVIDRVSPLDPTSETGETLENVEGVIELKDIKHIYPSRPEVVVMHRVNLLIPAGKTTALVGPSGSGKSTVVGLVERFYDPVGGATYLDGVDIRKLNLRWLRQQISLVQQEPVLFSTTIFENIRHGLIGTIYESMSEDKQRELIVNAAKMANAHAFITDLPEGYETNVGERGFLLSGGQKQRIAIARAVVSDPKILLLDEATSALDTKSEGVVQAALDAVSKGRTTIVIAHRLSTIKHANNIVVMSEGRIIEQGSHDELLEKGGSYHRLVEVQKISEGQEQLEAEQRQVIESSEDGFHRVQSEKSSRGYETDQEDKLNRTTTGKSLSSIALGKKSENQPEYSLWTLIKLITAFNKKEWKLMVVGLFFSIISGGGYPTQSVFFANSVAELSLPPSRYSRVVPRVSFWSLMYLMLAFVQLLAWLAHGIAFAYCSEKLVHRARDQAFRAILRQDIAFFDKDENSAGALTALLSTETTNVAGLSGITLGSVLSLLTTLISAVVLGISVGWKLGLVCTATIPILLVCGFLRFWMLAQFQMRAKKAYESSASYACEATSAIRTVASLNREQDVWNYYHEVLEEQAKKSLITVIKSSLLYAAAQSLSLCCLALGFWYGGTLIGAGEYTMIQFFICFLAIVFGSQSAGTIFSFAPDMGKARHSAAELKTLFDRKPDIDFLSTEGEGIEHVEGTIEFRDVHFRYPSRPQQPVLRGLNLLVKPGQYVALVGPSGCGKSTTISLLERFYDPLAGSIFVDNKEISSLNVSGYRRFLALVSQEPTLYQGTIRENVLLGSDRPDVSEEAVIQACKDANIYDFILSLPEGFNTVVGSKGSMLSGGQKQRIAIARALIRDPRILLLDEATSALDSTSEKVVQAALDAAAKGRTTIAVAHRLSTIQKADMIYVFDQGRIVESGTHTQLMYKKGKYFELVKLQSLEKGH
ncbi:MAG: GTPase-activating protein [Geoglossum umbratile]|nr:MAG: GTPase-activating protein [Geoglossum umbratile]